MTRRLLFISALLGLMCWMVACTNKKVQNPIADVNSKQPDKVLFDRAMDAMKHNRFDVSRITLQTLINTYPDSEYIARAKLAVGDSWYAEGGSAGLAQAEIEYKDFITFFPNMPEAAEAQLKVANIHYRQMEKPDRDFTHAKRAEEEYRQLILQFPDSKLVAEARLRLLEVQEVLAEREYRIGRFYYLRESWPAAIARLKSLTDTYPLYSQADDALFTLGQAYEQEVQRVRDSKMSEVAKGKMIKDFEDSAAEAYSKILTRYPVMGRAGEARQRLEALHRPVPQATPDAVAQNKSEEASRRETGRFGRAMLNFHRRPDVAEAAKVGEPTLVDPKQTSATEVAQRAAGDIQAAYSRGGKGANTVSVETVGTGAPAPNEAAPRSPEGNGDSAATATPAASTPAADAAPAAASPAPSATSTPSGDTAIPEITPNASAQTPAQSQGATEAAPAPPPRQVNDAASSSSSGSSASDNASSAGQKSADSSGQQSSSDLQDQGKSSSSKSKKKKGLKKIIPF